MTTSNDDQYGGWCTNWAAYDVPTLWKMLQGEDPTKTGEHVSAWRMTYELLSAHMAELRSCRDDLAAKWSAANSPAAAAFLGYVDNMLASMKTTSDAAVSNYAGLAGIDEALITAKTEIGKLNDQWQKYQNDDNSFLSTVSFHLLSDAPDNWKQELTLQAAKTMSASDNQVFQSSAKLTPAPTVNLQPSFDDREPFPADGSGSSGNGTATAAHSSGGWAQPPFIPAPVPVAPPAPSAPPPSPQPTPGHGGVLAGGVAAPPEVSPGPTPTPVPPGPPASGPALPPAGVIGPRPGPFDGESTMRRGLTGPESRTGATGRTPLGIEAEPASLRGRTPGGFGSEPVALRGRTALAPRGVIGGVEAAESRPAASSMRRVNPVGGVIGENPGGTVAATGGQSGGVAGQRGAKRRRDESEQHFDPDNPWVTEEGVPGVLVPPAEPTSHEAGPGVIGIDR